jgi:hypothetical protein
MPLSIFISHSSGDDHSSGDADRVRLLRDRLYEELIARGFKVLLDRKLLQGGMEWRPALHRWLGECDGAVILFSQAALESAWVLKESTILTWRRSLGSEVRVLPVLVGCQRQQVVEHRAFKPLDLGSLQFLQFDETVNNEQAVRMLVHALIGELAGLQPDASDAPLRAWIRDVALLLSKVDPVGHLKDAAEQLGIDADARSRFEDLPITAAHQLLHVGLSKTHGAFQLLRSGLDKERFERLVGLVVPTWVPLEAAANVLGILGRPPGMRRMAINSEFPMTGQHYLLRATCGKAVPDHMVTVSGVVGADDEQELLPLYERALWRAVGLDPDPVRPTILQKILSKPEAPIYIFLRADAARPILMPHGAEQSRLAQDLLSTYQHATFVFLTREPALWKAAGSVPDLQQIAPELLAEDEDDAIAEQALIRMLFTARKEASLGA